MWTHKKVMEVPPAIRPRVRRLSPFLFLLKLVQFAGPTTRISRSYVGVILSMDMFTPGARARLSLGTNVNTRFFKDPPQNSGTVSVPEYKVETSYSGTTVGVYFLGTQCLNTAPFCASAQALVLGYQVWTWP